MLLVRSLLGGVLMAATAASQQAEVMECSDVLASLAQRGKETAHQAALRLDKLLKRTFAGEIDLGFRSEKQLVLVGTNQQIAAAKNAMAQLARPDPQEARVQCTLVTMSAATAKAAGLVADKPLEVDEAKGGAILKQAVAAKGTLRNLPEMTGLPVYPFTAGKRFPEAPPADSPPFAGSEVIVEAMPLGEAQWWFGVQLVHSATRAEVTPQLPIEAFLRLEPGKGAMVMASKGEQATVLWVRFVGTRNAEPPKDTPAKDK